MMTGKTTGGLKYAMALRETFREEVTKSCLPSFGWLHEIPIGNGMNRIFDECHPTYCSPNPLVQAGQDR